MAHSSKSKMESAIGRGETIRDRPIIIHASHTHSSGRSSRFFTIEEKRQKKSGVSLENDELIQLYVPNSDEEVWFCSFVAVNSCLYFIGLRRCRNQVIAKGYMFLDLNIEERRWRWEQNGEFYNISHCGALACEDGFIYTVGVGRTYRVDPTTGASVVIPQFPEELGSVPSLIWASEKKLLGYAMRRGIDGANLLVCCDLESGGKWEALTEKPFWGYWSKGVLLYDRYLFSFGLGHPYEDDRLRTANVYVFDIEQRQWLPEPVDGLPNDGKVLPFIPPKTELGVGNVNPYLFLIGVDQGLPKLALVWATCEGGQGTVYCTKFIISRDDSTVSLFKARIVSSGVHLLGKDTWFLKCAARVESGRKN